MTPVRIFINGGFIAHFFSLSIIQVIKRNLHDGLEIICDFYVLMLETNE